MKILGLKRGMLVLFGVLLAMVIMAQSGLAFAGVPTDQVRATVDRVMAILQDPNLKSADKLQERRELLNKTISARFDFAEMAKRSMGGEWRRLTPAQQKQFVDLFAELLRDNYIADIESYKGEKVAYKREILDDDQQYAIVQTVLKSPKGDEYSINYKVYLMDREWKVYDVVIEDVSVVNNYRAQFARLINQSSIDGLFRALQEKKLAKKK
jgi:phospholipid transport system substrate-binding protein